MKKQSWKVSFALALVFALVITLIPVVPGTNSYGATVFSGGDGTVSNPYRITTKAELASVRNYPTKNFKLMNDISFSAADFQSGGAYYNKGAGWTPIGSAESPFTGSFNGNGKKISGLIVNMSAGGLGGLFGFNEGTISNLGVSGGTITVTGYIFAQAGSLAGHSTGTIQNCYSSATVLSSGAAGGIAGKSINGTVTKCFNAGSVSGITEVGGVCGAFGEGTLSYCYNTGKVTDNGTSAGSNIAGIAGFSDACTIKQCYNTGLVSSEFSTTGGIVSYVSSVVLTACYYLEGTGENTSGTMLTQTQTAQTESYAGFDFTNIWKMNSYNHLPALRTCPVRPASLTTFSLNLSTTYSDTSQLYRAVKSKWTAVANASGYKVAYRKSTNASWSVKYTTSTSWTFLGDAGSKYYVKVIPYISVAGVKYYSNSYSPEKSVYTLKAPVLQLTKSGSQDVKVQWNNIIGESGYYIYRKTGATGSWTRIKIIQSTTASSWTDLSTVAGKTYYYKIKAYKTIGSVNVYGPISTEKSLRL